MRLLFNHPIHEIKFLFLSPVAFLSYPGRRIRVHDTTRVTISFLNILSLIVKGNITSCLPPVDLLRKMADLVTASMKNDHLQVCW